MVTMIPSRQSVGQISLPILQIALAQSQLRRHSWIDQLILEEVQIRIVHRVASVLQRSKLLDNSYHSAYRHLHSAPHCTHSFGAWLSRPRDTLRCTCKIQHRKIQCYFCLAVFGLIPYGDWLTRSKETIDQGFHAV